MADKKMTAAEKKAAEEAVAETEAQRKATERRRLIGAGAVLAAVALFVGGYAVGNASDDDVVAGDVIFERDGIPFEFPDDFPEGFPRGPRGGFDFGDPDDFPLGPFFEDRFPEGFEFPDGFPRGPRGRFEFDFDESIPLTPRQFPREFDLPRGGFGFDCYPSDLMPGGFHCEFGFPDGFEFPFPDGPFFDEFPPDEAPLEIPDAPGFLGVSVVESDDGVVVVDIIAGSAAEDFGFAVDDVIVAVDNVELRAVDEFADAIGDAGAGTEVIITVIRNGREEKLAVILGFPPN